MRALLVSVLALLLGAVLGDSGAAGNLKSPQTYVYTRHPVEYGKENELICHCTDFHPPVIEMRLKHEGEEYQDCNQSDMTFKEDWAYYTTRSVKFIPKDGVKYHCDVKHNNGPVKSIVLDNPMK